MCVHVDLLHEFISFHGLNIINILTFKNLYFKPYSLSTHTIQLSIQYLYPTVQSVCDRKLKFSTFKTYWLYISFFVLPLFSISGGPILSVAQVKNTEVFLDSCLS